MKTGETRSRDFVFQQDVVLAIYPISTAMLPAFLAPYLLEKNFSSVFYIHCFYVGIYTYCCFKIPWIELGNEDTHPHFLYPSPTVSSSSHTYIDSKNSSGTFSRQWIYHDSSLFRKAFLLFTSTELFPVIMSSTSTLRGSNFCCK